VSCAILGPGRRRHAHLLAYTTLFRSCGNACRVAKEDGAAAVVAVAVLVEATGGAAAVAAAGEEINRLRKHSPGHGDMKTPDVIRSEEHTSELQLRENLVCRLLLEKKK